MAYVRRLALLGSLLLAACTVQTGPDPRDGFSERNVGRTVITYVDGLGTQAVYLQPSGGLHLWSSAGDNAQSGDWKYDVLATGAATTYQGAGGINHPVQELETAWGVCFRYRDANGEILRRPEGGDWNCALLADYEALIIDRAQGDIFSLQSGKVPGPMPKGERLTGSELERLG
ncbi:MAG: hypothetical protein AAGH68_15980 [Pseudomonadota bacterium]